MLFGLKVAPSLFQKAMIKVFEPMLRSLLYTADFTQQVSDRSSASLGFDPRLPSDTAHH